MDKALVDPRPLWSMRIVICLMLLLPLQAFSAATINLAYSPATINPGDPDSFTISLFNDNTLNGLSNAAVTLSLPTGVTISATPNVVDSCGFTSISVPSNGSLVQLSGGVVSQATTTVGSCTLKFDVKSVASGNHPTSIPAGPVSGFTPGGSVVGFSAVDNSTTITNATPATATLAVNTLSNLTGLSAFTPNSVKAGEQSQLSVTIINPNASVAVPLTSFTDTLPTGMVIAPIPGAAVVCTTGGSAGTLSSPNGAGSAVVAGDTSIILSGGSIAGGGSCKLAVNVTAPSSTGTGASKAYNDNPSAVTNGRGLSGTPTAGTLTVSSPVSVSQAFSPTTVFTGEFSTLTITIANSSTVNALTIGNFTDTFSGPGTVTLGTPSVSCTGGTNGSASVSGSTLTLSGAVAAAGSSCTITLTASMTGTGTLTSSSTGTSPATVMSTPAAGTVFVPTSTGTATVSTPASVTHTFTGGTLYAGDSSTLTITISNASTLNALSIDSYTETLTGTGTVTINGTPTVACTGGNIGSLSVSGGVITLTGATAKTAGSCVITASVSMATDGTLSSTTSAAPGTAFSNAVATSLSVTNNTNPRNKTVVTPISVTQSFSSSGGSVRAGQASTLTFSITNASVANTASIGAFSDLITAVDANGQSVSTSQISTSIRSVVCGGTGAALGTSSVDANKSIQLSGYTIGKLGACTVTADVTLAVAGTLSAITSASNASPAAVITNTSITPSNFTVAAATSTVPVISQFTVGLAASTTTGYLGLPLSYTITINNWSGSDATNVNFTDNLPNPSGGVQMVLANSGSALGAGCSGGTFTATPGASTVSWTGGTVVSGTGNGPGVCTITIATSMPSNSATGIAYVNSLPANTAVTGLDSGGGVITNSNAASVTVNSAAAVTISQAYSAAIRQFGSSVLTFTINNPTTTPLTSLSFSETLNSALTIAPSAGLSTTCSGTPGYTATPGTSSFAVSGLGVGSASSCTVKVNVTSSTVGTFASTIPAFNISTFEGQTNSASASASLTVNTALTATAAFSPTSTALGGSSRATLTFNNLGSLGFTNLTSTAPLGSGANTYVLSPVPNATTTCAGNPSIVANANSASISMSGATLAAGSSCTLSFDVTATVGGPWVLSIPVGNITTAEGARNTAAVTANLNTTTATAIGVNNSFSPNSITGGSPSVLQIDLTNPLGSTSAVSLLGITDTFPTGMVVYSNPNTSTTCSAGTVSATPGGNSVTLSGANLPVNTTCSVFVSVTSIQPVNLTNSIGSGAVTSREGFTNTVSSSATLSSLAGLGVLKSFAPTAISPGQTSRLSLQLLSTLTNITLTGVTVTDNLPSGVVIAPTPNVSSTCNITPAATGGATSFSISGVSLSPTTSCTVQVDVTAASAGTYTNTIPLGALTSTQGYSNQTPASATLTVMLAPTVSIAFGTSPVKAGAASTATVTIANTSSSQALSATALNFNLPSGLSVASTPNATTTCSGSTASAVAAGNKLSLTGASIPVSSSCTVKVDVFSNTPGIYAAQIPASSLSTAQGISNAVAANANLIVLQFPTVSQTISPSNILPGGTSVLTLTLGNANATPITLSSIFTDTLPVAPGNMTIASPNGLTTTCTGASVSAAVGGSAITYASGATLPANGGCTISVNVTAAALGTYTNAIPAGALATTAGNSQILSSVSLIVANGAPPTANAITSASVNANATTAQPLTSMSGVANASGATITSYQVATLPTAGTLYCNSVAIASVPSACVANGLSFLPSGTTPNPVTFTYTVTDSNNTTSVSATFSIPLTVNTAPVANGVSAAYNNNLTSPVSVGPLSATSQGGSTITSYTVTSIPSGATLSCSGSAISSVPTICAANGLTIQPVGAPTTASIFNYTATDTNGLTSSAASVTVNWNVPPVASSYTVTVSNAALAAQSAGTLSATAQIGATITGYKVTSLPVNATLYCSGTAISSVPASCLSNGLTIAPASLAISTTSFTYTATDSNTMTSAPATVTVNWSNKPIATAGLTTAIDPSINTVQLLNPLSGTTPNGGATVSTYTVVTLPTSGTLYCANVAIAAVPASCAANAVGYVPGSGFNTATFTFSITDSTGAVSDPVVYTIGSLASPSLKIAMTIASPLTIGFEGTYSIQVSNVSITVPTSAPVVVTDVLPVGLDYVSSTGNGWVCSWAVNTRTSVCSYAGILAPNTQAPAISLVVKPNVQAVPSGTTATISDTSVVSGGGELPSFANGTAPGAQPHSATVTQTVGFAAVISGSSWVDLNHNGVRDASEPIPAPNTVRVEIWPAGTTTQQTVGATPIASSLIDASGKYSLPVPAGNVQIRFVDVVSTATLGLPVNGDSPATRNQAGMTGSNGVISRGVIENINLTPGAALIEQSLPIDPQGIVYDSGTRLPVGGATVTLIANGANVPAACLIGGVNPVVTDAMGGTAGVYQFLLDFSSPACAALSGTTFTLDVKAPGFVSPSRQIKDGLNGVTVLKTPVGQGNFAVVSKASVPTGIDPTTHYFQFVLSANTQGVINNHIPVDGVNVAALNVSKSASKAAAEIGDTVRYTISVRNTGNGASPQGLITDRMPLGFKMLSSTASWTLGGISSPVTPSASNNLLLFPIPSIPAGSTASLVYTVRIGIGADHGDGVNHAKASYGSFESNDATATVKVSAGVFGVSACIVGKVFSDCGETGIQQEGAKGLSGVRIYMETGLSILTDADGKYSYCGVEPRTHALKLDSSTLPRGATPVITSNRNLGDPNSLIVDVKNGELIRGDFAVNVCGPSAGNSDGPADAANDGAFSSSGLAKQGAK